MVLLTELMTLGIVRCRHVSSRLVYNSRFSVPLGDSHGVARAARKYFCKTTICPILGHSRSFWPSSSRFIACRSVLGLTVSVLRFAHVLKHLGRSLCVVHFLDFVCFCFFSFHCLFGTCGLFVFVCGFSCLSFS